jgi:hypothetical protein
VALEALEALDSIFLDLLEDGSGWCESAFRMAGISWDSGIFMIFMDYLWTISSISLRNSIWAVSQEAIRQDVRSSCCNLMIFDGEIWRVNMFVKIESQQWASNQVSRAGGWCNLGELLVDWRRSRRA